MFNKKAISPVVATSLLLVVAVVAVVGFQGWYQTFSSNLFVSAEQDSRNLDTSGIEGIIGDTLYLKAGNNLTVESIRIDGNDCGINGTYSGTRGVDVSECLSQTTSETPEIVMVTDDKVLSKSVYLNNKNPSNSNLVSLSSSLSCDTDLDGDGFISYLCANYTMNDTIFEGKLDLDDTNSTIQVTDYCWLNGDKSSCESNFVVDGCGTGTVLDMGTGLCWQRNMSSAGDLNWADAFSYCSGLSLGGFTDWYLPSIGEFKTIFDFSRSSPAIIGGNNNKFTDVISDYYWTASTDGSNTAVAWIIRIYNGADSGNLKTNPIYVTCVR